MIHKFKNLFHHKKRPEELEPQERYPMYQIGRGTYGNFEVHDCGSDSTLRIGSFCSIASVAQIFLGGDHRLDWVTTYPFSQFWEEAKNIKGHPITKGDVIIGNDVWVGTDALIMSGVKIGDGAVIGARAVVTKDVPPYAIMVGNPARLIRYRFNDSTIQKLLEIKWWDWDNELIVKFLPLLSSPDIHNFLESFESFMTVKY